MGLFAYVGRRDGYPRNWFAARDVSLEVLLPEGFALVKGELQWRGDLIGDEAAEVRAHVRPGGSGEGMIEAVVRVRDLPPYEQVADRKRLFVYVTEGKISIRSSPVPSPGGESAGGTE